MLHCLQLKINFYIVFQTHHTLGLFSQTYFLELQNFKIYHFLSTNILLQLQRLNQSVIIFCMEIAYLYYKMCVHNFALKYYQV